MRKIKKKENKKIRKEKYCEKRQAQEKNLAIKRKKTPIEKSREIKKKKKKKNPKKI